jgi:hypothetical protein
VLADSDPRVAWYGCPDCALDNYWRYPANNEWRFLKLGKPVAFGALPQGPVWIDTGVEEGTLISLTLISQFFLSRDRGVNWQNLVGY